VAPRRLFQPLVPGQDERLFDSRRALFDAGAARVARDIACALPVLLRRDVP